MRTRALSEANVSASRTDARSAMARMSREAFEVFFAQTAPALRAYIARVSGNPGADDILQEAYIRLLNAAPIEEVHRKSYLYRTATNLIVDHGRAEARERNWLGGLWRRQSAGVSPRALASDL